MIGMYLSLLRDKYTPVTKTKHLYLVDLVDATESDKILEQDVVLVVESTTNGNREPYTQSRLVISGDIMQHEKASFNVKVCSQIC
jgi:hypothetical protein